SDLRRRVVSNISAEPSATGQLAAALCAPCASCANPDGIPPVFVSTGFSPEGAVAAALGESASGVPEAEPSPPRFAKAMAAMRRTTTPTTVTRLRDDERPVLRAPPYGPPPSPSGRWVRVWPVPP